MTAGGGAARAAGAAEQAGRALRRRIEEAIAALEPRSDRNSGERADAWRGARLLRLRYVEALPPEAVQRELGISRAQFYRDHARALDALGSLLAQQWPQPSHPTRLSQPSPQDYALPAAGATGTNGPLPQAEAEAEAVLTLHSRLSWQERGTAEAADEPASEARSPHLAPWPALVLTAIAWSAAWFAVWSFAQTTTWLIAWTVGGAASGLATGTILRTAAPAVTWRQTRAVVLAWTAAWPSAWLIGWLAAGFVTQVMPPDALAGADPNNLPYALGKVAGWAGGGLVMGSVIRRAAPPDSRPSVAAVGLGWAAAGGIGHAVFWMLAPSLDPPSIRFALSGLVEGAVGAAVTLWQLDGLWPPAWSSRRTPATPVPGP